MELEIGQLERKYERLRIRDRAHHRRLVSSLVEHGQQVAVLVVASGTPGHFVLVDGYRRVVALLELSRDLVEATELKLPEADALVFCHTLQATRPRSALEEGWWLVELVERHGKSQREVAISLDRSKSWVSRRLALVQALPESVQSAVRNGRIPPHGAMKVLVPLARANSDECERLVAALAPQSVSVRELELLYLGWKEGDPGQRERLVDHPRLFLKAWEEEHTARQLSPGPTLEDQPLIKELEALAGLCRRIRSQIQGGALMRFCGPEHEAVCERWSEVWRVVGSVEKLMEKERSDARSRYPVGDLALA